MITEELQAAVRLDAMMDDAAQDWTPARLNIELTNALTTKFERMVIDARCGYWMQSTVYVTTVGTTRVRVPPRAVSMCKVEIASGSGSNINYIRLTEVGEYQADMFSNNASTTGTPTAWVARGDQIQLLPAADGVYSIRVWYYIRPSTLVTSQVGSAISPAQVDRGRVTGVNTSTRAVTVNAIPFDQSLATPAVLTSGVQRIDVVHPDGWHELPLVSAAQTFSGLVFTVGGSDELDEIAVGDYVRVAEQTDWPPLPDDFHRCLADICAVKILIQQSNPEKASGFAQDVSADLERFNALISNRVKESHRTVPIYAPSLRGWWR